MDEIIVKIAQPDDEQLHLMIGKLDADLLGRYPADEIFGVDFTDPKVRDMLFAVAYLQDEPVGCGAIRPLDTECAELKRFFVDSEYRNRGIAGRILAFLEGQARARKFNRIKLESGTEQPEANSFYMKHGYVRIDRYGEYVNNESSVCFEKALS